MKYIGIDCRAIEEIPTGIGNYMKSIVPEIIKKDKSNVYYLIFNKGNIYQRYLDRYSKSTNVKVVIIKSKTQSILSQITLQRELKKIKLNLFITDIFGSVFFIGIPYILILHDIIGIKNPKFVSLQYRLYNRIQLKWSITHAKKIFTLTHTVKNDILNYLNIKGKKIKVISAGITIPKVYPDVNIQDKYNIHNDYFVYIGNDKPHKNIRGLVNAFIKYKKKFKNNTELILIGVKEDSKALIKRKKKYIKPLGIIKEQEKLQILRNAISLVTLSFDEGFGLPILEATYLKIPIICSNIDAFKEILDENQAIFVNPKSTMPVAKALNLIYTDDNKREDLIKNSQDLIKKYSWAKTAKKIIKEIK